MFRKQHWHFAHKIGQTQNTLWTKFYTYVRFVIIRRQHLQALEQHLPSTGHVLDIGCGFGLFALYLALKYPSLQVRGVDQDEKRIQQARQSAQKLGLDNIKFEVGDATQWEGGQSFDVIYAIDLIHHLPRTTVPGFLKALKNHLKSDGQLLLKDIAHTPMWGRWFTLLLDRVMVGWDPIYYWPTEELRMVLQEASFRDIKVQRIRDVLPYPHVLFRAVST